MSQQPLTFEKQIIKTLRLSYLLFLPRGYNDAPAKEWPLILFLHGADERGDDLEVVKKHGIPRIAESQPDFPFVAVSPQCPEGSWWPMEFEALTALLDEVVSAYRIDTHRLYLTGLSMGGYGAWHLAVAHPDRFAAIAPICGGFHGPPRAVSVLKDVPVWAFHGAKDTTVPLEQQQKVVNVLQECGGNIRFTVYPEAAHDSWTQTYDTPKLYQWFLEQAR